MPKSTDSAAAIGLPVSGPLGRIPAGARATIIPANRRGFLKTLAAAAALGSSGAALTTLNAETSPDAELLALREPMLAAWHDELETFARLVGDHSSEADRALDAVMRRSSDIAKRIAAFRATSLAGLGVQAIALSWSHSGETITAEEIGDCRTTDMLLLASIATALIGMQDGMPEVAHV